MKRVKPKEDAYKEIDLKKAINNDMREYLNNYSEKIPLLWNYELMIGYKKIGHIKRISTDYFPYTPIQIDKKTNKVIVVTPEQLKKESDKKVPIKKIKVYIFEVYKDNLIGKMKFLLGFRPEYFAVKSNLLTKSGTVYSIKEKASFSKYLTINIFSEETKGYIENISYKISREVELKELVNFTPRMIFLEGQSARFRQRGDVLVDLEKAKKTQEEGLTKG